MAANLQYTQLLSSLEDLQCQTHVSRWYSCKLCNGYASGCDTGHCIMAWALKTLLTCSSSGPTPNTPASYPGGNIPGYPMSAVGVKHGYPSASDPDPGLPARDIGPHMSTPSMPSYSMHYGAPPHYSAAPTTSMPYSGAGPGSIYPTIGPAPNPVGIIFTVCIMSSTSIGACRPGFALDGRLISYFVAKYPSTGPKSPEIVFRSSLVKEIRAVLLSLSKETCISMVLDWALPFTVLGICVQYVSAMSKTDYEMPFVICNKHYSQSGDCLDTPNPNFAVACYLYLIHNTDNDGVLTHGNHSP